MKNTIRLEIEKLQRVARTQANRKNWTAYRAVMARINELGATYNHFHCGAATLGQVLP